MAFSFLRANRQILQHFLSAAPRQQPVLPSQLRRLCSTHPSLKLATAEDKKDSAPILANVNINKYKTPLSNVKYQKINEPLKEWTLKTLKGVIADPRKLHDTPEMKSVCSLLEKDALHLTDYHLANILRSLIVLKIDPNSQLIRVVENEILWKSRKMSLRMLLMHLDIHLQYQESDVQKQVMQHLIEAVEKRVFELTPPTLLKVLSQMHLFNPSIVPKMEDKALEMLDQMAPEQLVKLLGMLSQAKLRPTSLLGGIAYYLTKHPSTMSPNNCLSILFSLNSLSYPHLELFTKVTEDLAPALDSLSKPKLLTLISLLGQLHWNSPNTLELCLSKLLDQVSQLQYKEICFLVNTLGCFRYVPNNMDIILNVLREYQASPEAVLDYRWLNLVWNLSILGNYEFLPTIHKPGLCAALIKDANQDKYKAALVKLKLLNLNALSLHLNPKNPNLLPQIGSVEVPHPALDEKLNDAVITCLHTFIPKEGDYLKPNVICPSLGIRIDAEFVVNSDCNPVPYSSSGLEVGKTSLDSKMKPLPTGLQRIALLTLSFRNLILNSSEPLGKVTLVEQLLSGAGYTVVKVPFKEFDAQPSGDKKGEYLKDLIHSACTKKANK